MTAGIVLMCAKYLSIIVHNLFSKFSKTLRGLQLQVAGFFYGCSCEHGGRSFLFCTRGGHVDWGVNPIFHKLQCHCGPSMASAFGKAQPDPYVLLLFMLSCWIFVDIIGCDVPWEGGVSVSLGPPHRCDSFASVGDALELANVAT